MTIVDNCGSPVAGATVTGQFTGSFNETVSAVTGGDGVVAVLVTAAKVKKPAYTLTVTGVTHPTLGYAPGDNVENSDFYPPE